MEVLRLENFLGGWFIGDFLPTVFRTENFELCLKRYARGDVEPLHHQRIATEYTVIVSGRARFGNVIVKEDDIVVVQPEESCDFQALEDVVLVAVKVPSLPADKQVD